MQAWTEQEETKWGSRRLLGVASMRCCWRRRRCCRGGGTTVAGEAAPSSSSPSIFFSSFFLSVFWPFSLFFFFLFFRSSLFFLVFPSPLSSLSLFCFSLLSLYSSLFFSFLFLCFLSLLPLFFSFLSLSWFFVLSPTFFFIPVCLLSPLYLRGEKDTYTPTQSMVQGCRVDGAATVQPPLYHPRDTSPLLTLTRGKLYRWRVPGRRLFRSLGEGKAVKTRGRKIFFFPFLTRPGEEEDPQCHQNGTISGFFLMNSGWNDSVLDKSRRFI